MSVATELVAAVPFPDRAGGRAWLVPPARLASVTVLRPPRDVAGSAPVRLTRRGVAVVTVAVLVIGVVLVWLGRSSAASAPPTTSAPRAVTVQAGDTLWSIASRVAPQRDPRAEVQALQRRNHLLDVDLLPGQVLRIP